MFDDINQELDYKEDTQGIPDYKEVAQGIPSYKEINLGSQLMVYILWNFNYYTILCILEDLMNPRRRERP